MALKGFSYRREAFILYPIIHNRIENSDFLWYNQTNEYGLQWYCMSNYILDLRKIVGHRPLLQVGASVIVVDSENRILRNTEEIIIAGDMQAVL